MAEAVRTERNGAVARVWLNRPEKLNALNVDVLHCLEDVAASLRDDMDVRVVVLRGEGRAFSAGADLSSGAAAAPGSKRSWSERRHLSGSWQRLLDAWESLPQVTVAGLHGHCIGGAFLLAGACDIRVADATLQLRIPELAIGIPLTWGGVPRLAREIGLPLTRDLVMTGRLMDADEASRCGFVQRLSENLDAGLTTVVEELLAMPDAPLRMTKSLTAALSRDAVGAAAWADADMLSWSGGEPEGQQAAADYAEKRKKR